MYNFKGNGDVRLLGVFPRFDAPKFSPSIPARVTLATPRFANTDLPCKTTAWPA